MADTLTPEKWERKESADWWSAGQAARQQNYGAATEIMLDLAGVQAGSRVLDVAAGTGESTLMAAARVGSKGRVVAADASASMLNVAAEAARQAGLTNVETRVMNAENLELDKDSFDAVICSKCSHAISESSKSVGRDAPCCETWMQSRRDCFSRFGEKSVSRDSS
jgi:ubiquinone/menaquinone biosynthesis C-methylase UbiE